MNTPELAQNKDLSHQDLQNFVRKTILKAVLGILGLLILGALTFYFFNPEIQYFTTWTAQKFGFWGMAAIVFLADTLITPFPPDLILVIIAKSPLQENWFFYVSILGILSVIGGNIGALVGRQLSRSSWAQNIVRLITQQNSDYVQKLGFWAIVLGAATPVPFSITCWTAGFLGMKKRLIALACLVRLPRYYIYYLLITYSDILGNTFNN